MSQMIFTALRLPDHVVKLIDQVAEEMGVTRSAVIRRWIYDSLDVERPGLRLRAGRKLFGPSIVPHREGTRKIPKRRK